MTEIQAKLFFNRQGDIELITYDYSQNEYKKVLEEAYKKDLNQIIFTTSIYKKVIEKVYEDGFYLTNINFMDFLDDHDFSDVKQLLSQMIAQSGNENFLNLLLKEIDWCVNNESIDIKSIVIYDRDARQKVEIYNNGVILGELDQMEKIKTDILSVLGV